MKYLYSVARLLVLRIEMRKKLELLSNCGMGRQRGGSEDGGGGGVGVHSVGI